MCIYIYCINKTWRKREREREREGERESERDRERQRERERERERQRETEREKEFSPRPRLKSRTQVHPAMAAAPGNAWYKKSSWRVQKEHGIGAYMGLPKPLLIRISFYKT